jgi:TolB-like protein/Flp pilus assembly protein TadD/predicted Ser/Thr protein kinase
MEASTSEPVRVCQKCGAKVFADSPGGFCGACLFRTGLGVAEDSEAGLQKNERMQVQFGDYDLIEEIGRGGQGVVYRARQKSLNRTVALKVIGLGQWSSTPHLKRFRHEAEAAASLEHTQIVPIYEIGERDGSCYFSMKFIEGGQLDDVLQREPMPPRRAAELLVKIARTVHFAHERGILHRDIKPGNILLDRYGEPHLTDFGLARLIEQESTITNSFDVLGTPSYMAPEQAAGRTRELTPAADIYSLGAIFYQMLTGQPPFAGGTTYETIRLVMETEPRNPRLWNPKVDVDLATICLKCLEKEPAKRYATAQALAEDLERWLRHEPIRARRTGIIDRGWKWVRRNPTRTALIGSLAAVAALAFVLFWNREPASRPSGIAVLPFQNLGGDKENAYFADGIQDEILTRLSKVANLKVISHTSTQHYRNVPRNLPEIAKRLGVAHVLEGSVQKNGDTVRVNVQLIKAANDSHLWAETFDRKLTDIFSVESEIAKAIADQLRAKLTGDEEQVIAAKPTDNMEAYDLYLRGQYFWNKRTNEGFERSINYFRQAINKDPRFARAYAALADSYVLNSGYNSSVPPTEVMPKAHEAAARALELDEGLAEAHTALAVIAQDYDWDWKTAEREYRRAIELNPNYATAHHWYAEYLALQGRFDEAFHEMERARQLDPLSLIIGSDNCVILYYARQYDRSIAQCQAVLQMEPTFLRAHQPYPYVEKGLYAAAVADVQQYQRTPGVDPAWTQALLAYVYGRSGQSTEAERALEELKELSRKSKVDPQILLLAYVGMGKKDDALTYLEKAYAAHSISLTNLKVDPAYDRLRSEPRFQDVLRGMGLPP